MILYLSVGLGKTIQVIAFFEHLRKVEYIHGPFLVVVPLGTVSNWKSEVETWTDMNVVVYHDPGTFTIKGKEARQMLREQEFYYPGTKKCKFNILVTTYEVLVTDTDILSAMNWKIAVIDEGHRIKNKTSRLLDALKTLNCNRRLLLTGTPLQNNISELYTLLNFLEPDIFSSHSKFIAQFGDLQEAEQVKELQTRIKPFILRRMKETVEKSIPPKEETIIDVELTTLQKKYYKAIYEKNFQFLRRGNQGGNMPRLVNIEIELRKCCVSGDTLVTLADGTSLRIDEMKQDMNVLAYVSANSNDNDSSDGINIFANSFVAENSTKIRRESSSSRSISIDTNSELEDLFSRISNSTNSSKQSSPATSPSISHNSSRRSSSDSGSCNINSGNSSIMNDDLDILPTESMKVAREGVDTSAVPQRGDGVASALVVDAFRQPETKRCVKLTLCDGTSLVCTPDHQILVDNFGWKEAGVLVKEDNLLGGHFGSRNVVYSSQFAATGWTRTYAGICDKNSTQHYSFTFTDVATPAERLKLYSLGLLIGYIISHGCCYSTQDSTTAELYVGHKLDVVEHQQWIKDCFSTAQEGTLLADRFPYHLRIPSPYNLVLLQVIGQKTEGDRFIPGIIDSPGCPRVLLVGFLRGLFGGGGIANCFSRIGIAGRRDRLQGVQIMQSANQENMNNLYNYVFKIQSMLSNHFNIKSLFKSERLRAEWSGAKKSAYSKIIESLNTQKSKDFTSTMVSYVATFLFGGRAEIRLSIPSARDNIAFQREIGFAGCVQKRVRNEAACVVFRMIEYYRSQLQFFIDRSNHHNRRTAKGQPESNNYDEIAHDAKADMIRRYGEVHHCFETSFSANSMPAALKARMGHHKKGAATIQNYAQRDILDWLQAYRFFDDSEEGTVKGAAHATSIRNAQETMTGVIRLSVLKKEFLQDPIPVYDLTVPSLQNFIASGCVIHNCNHPWLVQGAENSELGAHCSDQEYMRKTIAASGKFVLLDKLLPKLKDDGHRVLIFTQMIPILDLIQEYCDWKNWTYERLDGSIRGLERSAALERFNAPDSNRFIFLLTTRAGGVGLNLASADTVIIFDSDWNPQQDMQAQARAHRIGQKNKVSIYRLVTRNTYESVLFLRASKKLGLDHAILTNLELGRGDIDDNDKDSIDKILKLGAYSLFDEEESNKQSREFEEQNIDDILKTRAHVIKVSKTARPEDAQDGDGPIAAPQVVAAGNSHEDIRNKFRLNYTKMQFSAEQGSGNIDINDPKFWDKVMGEKAEEFVIPPDELLMQLTDKTAYENAAVKVQFFDSVTKTVLAALKKKAAGEEVPELDDVVNLLIQFIPQKEFPKSQRDQAKVWLEESEKRTRSVRSVRSREQEEELMRIKNQATRDRGATGRRKKGQFSDDEDFESLGSESEEEKASDSEFEYNISREGLSDEMVVGGRRKGRLGVIMNLHVCDICHQSGELIACEYLCCRWFHLECLGITKEDLPGLDENWICPDCKAGKIYCYACREVGSVDGEGEDAVKRCSVMQCGRYYHSACARKYPTAIFFKESSNFRCPCHYCARCDSQDPGMWMAICQDCPTGLHVKCFNQKDVRLTRTGLYCDQCAAKEKQTDRGRKAIEASLTHTQKDADSIRKKQKLKGAALVAAQASGQRVGRAGNKAERVAKVNTITQMVPDPNNPDVLIPQVITQAYKSNRAGPKGYFRRGNYTIRFFNEGQKVFEVIKQPMFQSNNRMRKRRRTPAEMAEARAHKQRRAHQRRAAQGFDSTDDEKLHLSSDSDDDYEYHLDPEKLKNKKELFQSGAKSVQANRVPSNNNNTTSNSSIQSNTNNASSAGNNSNSSARKVASAFDASEMSEDSDAPFLGNNTTAKNYNNSTMEM
jgi:hypothetical protein